MADMAEDKPKEDSAIVAWLEEKRAIQNILSMLSAKRDESVRAESRIKTVRRWLVRAYNFGRTFEHDKQVESYDNLANRTDKLKRALQMYGKHMDRCPARPRFLRSKDICTCGLDNLRA